MRRLVNVGIGYDCVCSAGVGRTGTLIAIDMALTLAPTEGTVDIPKILTILRQQRMKMVQTAVSL